MGFLCLVSSSHLLLNVTYWLEPSPHFLHTTSLIVLYPIPFLSSKDHWKLMISSRIVEILLNLVWVSVFVHVSIFSYILQIIPAFKYEISISFFIMCSCSSSLIDYISFQDFSSENLFFSISLILIFVQNNSSSMTFIFFSNASCMSLICLTCSYSFLRCSFNTLLFFLDIFK